jgi:glycosyltransferase involved in cell wall biosynthesis/GT2 family glycosyltransferase
MIRSNCTTSKTPLRVLIALPGLHRVLRGAETAMEEIARHLVRDCGFEVTLIGSGPNRAHEPYTYRRAACVSRERFERLPSLPFVRDHYMWEELTFAPSLARSYRAGDFDVTMTCGYPYTNWLLRAKGGPKHVFVTQNGDWMCRSAQREYRYFNCDALVCTNPEYFERHKNHWQSALIANGVDLNRFKPGAAQRSAFGLPNDAPVVLMVSALMPSKRVLDGIRAVAALDGVHLVVAGSGEMRDEVLRTGNELLKDRFHLRSLPREQMPALYRTCDALLHMSIDEPSANAFPEALASGLPIVAHDRPVTRWTLEDQALLVDTTDRASVADGLKAALNMRSPWHLEARRELAARRFSWTSIAQQYAEFLERIVQSRTTGVSPVPPLVPARCGQDARGTEDLGVVAIGRNEGARLRACLDSLNGVRTVYVDSGSTDDSVAIANACGAAVVQLSADQPFTAARARNAGCERLMRIAPDLRYVQFIDGDCELSRHWLKTAALQLDSSPNLAVVAGRRRERNRDASIYNRLCDLEWDVIPGEATECGGDAMMRADSFKSVNGFDESLIAGEEPDLCVRLRRGGLKILRLADDMTVHDSSMTRFGQWWRRNVRAGHAFAEGAMRHGFTPQRHWLKQWRSNWMWALLPMIAIDAALVTHGWGLLLLLVYPIQAARIYRNARRRWDARDARLYALFCLFGKFPQALGQLQFILDRMRGRRRKLIEYKQFGRARGTDLDLVEATGQL